MAEAGITVLPSWPPYSPDLKPQENVWSWAGDRLRELELDSDMLGAFQIKGMKALSEYPIEPGVKLIRAIAKRLKEVIEAELYEPRFFIRKKMWNKETN